MEKNKAIFFGIIIGTLVIITIYDYGYKYIKDKKDEISQLKELKMKELIKYNEILKSAQEIEKQHNSTSGQITIIKESIIEAQTNALAAAQIQDIINKIIGTYGGLVRRINVKKTEDLPPYQIIQIEVDAKVPDITALNDIIYDIEAEKQALVISSIDIRIINYSAPTELTIDLDISALTK
ncbi:General secretion pathway M protein [Candidatus Magnetoovum chiemensis]|nr:General secretion pathway M protein [Candidatus Magnetoovum chiemensis]